MRVLLYSALVLLFSACLEPTEPAFQLEESFYLVEGRIVAGQGDGEIRIRESAFTEVSKQFIAVEGATVRSTADNGASIAWEQTPGVRGAYRLPETAIVQPGEIWRLNVLLPDGTSIESEPEIVPLPVAITGLDVVFEQNAVFDPGRNRFIPRSELFISYNDPAGEENFYAYEYRYWEREIFCASCSFGRWQNGACVDDPSVIPRFDYYCEGAECYRMTAGTELIYRTDEFTDGGFVTGALIGGIPFLGYGELLVESSLVSVTRAGYDYGKVIEDLTSGNAGLNATTPAALDGNVRNLDPDGRTVLGFFGAAARSSVRAFVDRTQETGVPIRTNGIFYPHPIDRVPCDGPGRTAERPEGWGM